MHKAEIVYEFLKSKNISTITWSSRSSDLNIFEDAWKIIFDMVYDGPQLERKKRFAKEISGCHMCYKLKKKEM